MIKLTKKFSRRLLKWWQKNKRDFVWRQTSNPYRIAIAEMMLQRTKADQVVPIYRKFLEKYPTPASLAAAPAERVKKELRGLGLTWRTAKIQEFAADLVKNFGGNVPSEREKLCELPGIGDYVADAILCFGYGKNVATVDANVVRILKRVFRVKTKGEARRDPKIRSLAQILIPHNKAKEFNWAMIDLAALICTPRNPKCSICPIRSLCIYAKTMK